MLKEGRQVGWEDKVIDKWDYSRDKVKVEYFEDVI